MKRAYNYIVLGSHAFSKTRVLSVAERSALTTGTCTSTVKSLALCYTIVQYNIPMPLRAYIACMQYEHMCVCVCGCLRSIAATHLRANRQCHESHDHAASNLCV